MPFTRKFSSRRRYSRKPKRFVRSSGYKKIAKIAKKVFTKEVKKVIEPKFYDSTYSTAITSTGAIFTPFATNPAEDDGGDTMYSLKNISIQCKGMITNPDATDQQLRVMLIKEKRGWLINDSALPAVTDVLVSADVNSFPVMANKDRFKILMDRRYTIQALGEGNTTIKVDFYKRLRTITKYKYVDPDYIPLSNRYFLLVLSTDAAGGMTTDLHFRHVYMDA